MPSVCSSAVSTNRPTPKPNSAPGTEPISSPTDATSSGDRSAGTPNTVICATAVSCRMPPSRPRAARRAIAGPVGVTASACRSRRERGRCSGFVSTSTYSSRRRSAAGRTWMRRSSSPSPSSTRLHRADQDPGREQRLQPRRDRAGGDDPLALLDELAARDELEQQVAGGADRGVDRARLAGAGGLGGDAELLVGEQHHDRVAVGDRLDLADEALAVDHGLVGARRRRSSPC